MVTSTARDQKTAVANGSSPLVLNFGDLRRQDVPLVGGKNSSLGEMIYALESHGVAVPPGFATTSTAYWHYVDANALRDKVAMQIAELQSGRATLSDTGHAIRTMFLRGTWPA